MKRMLVLGVISMLFATALTACSVPSDDMQVSNSLDLPSIVFLVRHDRSTELGSSDLEGQNVSASSLCFYDKNGDYYISNDSYVNTLDNKTLYIEYEAGNLTEKLQHYKSIDVDELSNHYAKLIDIYRNKTIEIERHEHLPDVEAAKSDWYGYYFDEKGNCEYQVIHRNQQLTDFYTNNDTVNEVYDWIINTSKNTDNGL